MKIATGKAENFLLIANKFYVHEFADILEHQDVEYFDIQSGEDWPELMFNRFTLGLMMNAVNSGSEFTKELPEYADWCDENNRGLEDRLAIVLSILKKTFPKTKENILQRGLRFMECSFIV